MRFSQRFPTHLDFGSKLPSVESEEEVDEGATSEPEVALDPPATMDLPSTT